MAIQDKKAQHGPEREREIGVRLKEVREFLSFSQSEFAAEIGIKKARLSSYETGRVPMPWEIALRVCHQHLVSEHWLAMGGGRAMGLPGKRLRFGDGIVRKTMIQPANLVLKSLPSGLPFSAAYDLVLKREYWERSGQCARTYAPLDFSKSDSAARLERQMDWTLKFWRSILPKQAWGQYCVTLMKCGALVFDSFKVSPVGVVDNPDAAAAVEAWLDAELEQAGLLPEKKGS